MGTVPFKFLSDDEFAALDARARIAYLARAQRELLERRRVLNEQVSRTVIADGVPIPIVRPDEQSSDRE